MKQITTKQAAKGAKGQLVFGTGEREIGKVVIDSRQADETALFVAIQGENQDGHIFADGAAKLGCRVFMLSREDIIEQIKENYPDAEILCVDDTVKGLQELSRWYLAQFSIIKVAVTGSTGKTSTKEMTAAVLGRKYTTVKNEGNLNNELGLPLTIFKVDDTTEAAVFEMGMSSFGEIHLLADLVRPDMALITNVGTSHIEFLKSRENIMKAKMEVADYFDEKNTLIVNSDNEYLGLSAISRYVNERHLEDPEYKGNFKLVTVGEVGTQALNLYNIDDLGEEGITFEIGYKGERQEFKLPLPGRHNAHNAILAVAAGVQCGVSLKDAARGLKSLSSTSRRLVIEQVGAYKLIDDSYNSSPDSIAAGVDVLKHVTGQRKVAILADILELGEQSEELHRLAGKFAVKGGAQVLIACGPEARYMAEGAREWLNEQSSEETAVTAEVLYFEEREELQEQLETLLQEGDVVLVKGSNGMKMSLVAEQIRSLHEEA
ncbi:MAG: UDP-N-acetylmuramoyl-tripeptide--D-alanyl-D-alanine ligase [Firmicutes bacterium]|nr:UDP-N-acetylmuramoyl-tripeptide--D-alanyl-D-alanine ligase [Bacillota bacterium]